jgi:hypothetical protein
MCKSNLLTFWKSILLQSNSFVTFYGVTIDGIFLLVIGFIEHLQIVTTSNYSAVANSHTLQFTTARTKSSHSFFSLSSRCLATASNAVDPSFSS